MEINIKHEHNIKLLLQKSELMKIDLILQGTFYPNNKAVMTKYGYYVVELSMTQLTYILNYLLSKEEK